MQTSSAMGNTMSNSKVPPSHEPLGERLDSWKEIAAYLNRYTRTVQRWEKQEGLPVHRLMHSERGTVYAFKGEVDAWWNSRRAKLEGTEQRQGKPLNFVHVGAGLALTGVLLWGVFFAAKWRPPSLRPVTSRLLATIDGSSQDSQTGIRVAAADVNGDGLADSVVSAQGASETGIIFSGALRGHLNLATEASVLVREEHNHGLTLMGTADINGDGIRDLIWAERLPDPQNFSATGQALVVFGRHQWKSKLNLPSDADLRLLFPVHYNAGPYVAVNTKTADWNGDGIDDLILTASEYSPPGRPSAGAVFVFWGRRKWPRQVESTQSDVVIWGAQRGEGLSEVAVGDVNGDGRNDLVVAGSDGPLWGFRQMQGRVYAFFGRERYPRQLDAARDYGLRIEGAALRDHFSSLTLGDLNGDGVQDIVVGASAQTATSRRGRVYVYYGRRKWARNVTVSQAEWQLTDKNPSTWFGFFVAAYDLNRDGSDDLIVCAPRSEQGQLMAFYGGPQRQGETMSTAAEFVLQSDGRNDSACTAMPGVGDFDGDAIPEILVGAPTASVSGQPHLGKAYIFAPYLPIKIDIRPGNYPNPAWPGSEHLISVAVPGQPGFDPKRLDASSVRFAGLPAVSGSHCPAEASDAVCFFFDSKGLRLKVGDRTAVLTGRTKDGVPVFGVDAVLVLPVTGSGRQ